MVGASGGINLKKTGLSVIGWNKPGFIFGDRKEKEDVKA